MPPETSPLSTWSTPWPPSSRRASPTLNALWVSDLEAAREAARSSEQRWAAGHPAGPLDGVPVTVKENLARAGVPMPAGNAGVEPVVPQRNSPVVDRIDESGGVILGSTVMPDWGMLSSGVSSLHGMTRSPWNPEWTTGGSSSGAGAAAAAGLRPPPRRHRHRRLHPAARHLAGTDDPQAERRPRTTGHALPRPVRRPDDAHSRRRGAADGGHQPPGPARLDQPAAGGSRARHPRRRPPRDARRSSARRRLRLAGAARGGRRPSRAAAAVFAQAGADRGAPGPLHDARAPRRPRPVLAGAVAGSTTTRCRWSASVACCRSSSSGSTAAPTSPARG